jgi:hypothetical protein
MTCDPLVAAISAMLTGVVAVDAIVIASVDVRHEITVKTKVVETAFDGPALLTYPVTVVVYTPATVGIDHDIVLVVVLNVINDVLWPLFAVVNAL